YLLNVCFLIEERNSDKLQLDSAGVNNKRALSKCLKTVEIQRTRDNYLYFDFFMKYNGNI
ncbi:MAG: hypothetical protein RR751_05840, partial [Clostridia bacterium]